MSLAPALRLLALVTLLGGSADAGAISVIEPSQNLQVRRAVGPAGSDLGAGWSVSGWELAGERVDIRLSGAAAEITVSLRGARGPGGQQGDWLQTRQGWLRSAPGLPAEVMEALKQHLERPGSQVTWRVHPIPSTPSKTPDSGILQGAVVADRAHLRARVAARLEGSVLPEEALPEDTARALELLLGGDGLEVRRRLARPSAELSSLGEGAYSVWLAAGHVPQESLPELLERLPNEPRLLSLMAARAYEEGRYDAAGWWLDAALKTPLADGEALRLGALFGWTSVAEREGVLPPTVAVGSAIPSAWTTAGAVAWCLLLFVAIRRRRWRLGLALAVGLAVSILVIPPRAPVERPSLPPEIVHPLAGDPCTASPARFDGDALLVHLRCPEGQGMLLARARSTSDDAFTLTEHHAVSMTGLHDESRSMEPQLERGAMRLNSALETVEAQGFRLKELAWTQAPPLRQGWPDWRSRSDPQRAQHRVVAGLIAAAWILLVFTLGGMVRRAHAGWSSHPRTRWSIAGAFGFALLAHLLAPARMVMVFGGYDLTTHLVDGLIPRYGAGALWTYGPWLWTFGHDHAVIQLANRLLGWLLVVVAWDLGRQLYPSRPRALAIAAWAMALMPVIWRAHSSESIVVGPALFLLLAMRALSAGKEARPGEAALWGVAAATARPEVALVVCMLPLWVVLSRLRWPRAPLATCVTAAAGYLLIAVHLVSVISTARELSASGALPALDNPVIVALGSLLWVGIFANVSFTPLGLTPLLVTGVIGSLKTRRALATLGVALLWVVLTSVDLVEVSVPRLHVPALLLTLPLVGFGWEWLESRVAKGRGARGKLVMAAALLVTGCGYNAYQMFGPTNEDVEEGIWREAIDRLPVEARCLAVMGYGDPPPAEKTPRHNPLYLLRDRHPHVQVSHLDGIPEAVGCEGQHYALIGLRCYADLREDGRPQPQGNQPLPVCARALEEHVIAPVFERYVTNHGDQAFELYPTGTDLRVGLFRVTPGR